MTVYINGTTGYSGPVGTIGDLTTTGNTTLGDASGDTLTINGSTTTLTQGTANGVAYLNGSKVLTTGSALVFDGTNLGVGVSPSSWSAGWKAIELPGGTAFANNAGDRAAITWNAVVNGGAWTYKANGAANRYEQTGGSHYWYYAGSGTAGNIISFTQAMTLDASGNLNLNVTGKSFRCVVVEDGSTNSNSALTGSGFILGRTSGFDSTGESLALRVKSGSGISGITYPAQLFAYQVNALELYTSGAAPVVFGTSATERARIDSSGNLLVGTTTAIGKLTVHKSGSSYSDSIVLSNEANYGANQGIAWGSSTNISGRIKGTDDGAYGTNLIFETRTGGPSTSTTERARIDSSGNLLVGTTSALASTALGRINSQNTTLPAFVGAASSSSFTGSTLMLGSGTTAGTGFNHIACYVATGGSDQFATGVFFVRGNGNTVNTNNSYGAISDVKLKENITDATPKLAQLSQVRVVNYNLIGDEHKQIGVIAQELEQIFPSMVDETVDRDTEGNDLGTTTKQVKYSVFVPMLIKAIQEQQAIIESLKARLDAANL